MATCTLEAHFKRLSVHDENREDQKSKVRHLVQCTPVELIIQIP